MDFLPGAKSSIGCKPLPEPDGNAVWLAACAGVLKARRYALASLMSS